MRASNNNRRPAFPNRPWIGGKLYDEYARTTIMHMDAYLIIHGERSYLIIDWREGGFKRIALDAYWVEPDGLTPVEGAYAETMWLSGKPEYWTRANHATMRRLHKTVLAQPAQMLALGRGRWARVVMRAHYVWARESDCEITGAANKYVERKPYTPRAQPACILSDIL